MSWNTNDNVDPIFQDWGEAYKELCELLKAKVPEIKHLDLYYGQDQIVDSDGNWLPFRAPAVFLDFAAAKVDDMGDLAQQLEMDITVWVATETVQDTNHGSAGQRRAMEFVGLMRKLHVALHNASGEHYSPLSRVGMQRKADAPPYMYMYGQTYRCIIHDNSTSPQLAYLQPPIQLEIEPLNTVPPINPDPGACPTVQQLIPITTVQVIAQSLTTQQAADLYIVLGGNAGDLETLVGQATPEQLYAVMTPQQVAYVQGLLPPVQIRNSAGTLLETVSGGDAPVIVPDGFVQPRNSANTPLGAGGSAPSGGTAFAAVPDVEHTQSNGSAVILPAGVPMVCTPPVAGDPIIYAFGRNLWSGQVTSYRAGDEGSMLADGFFDHTFIVSQNSLIQRLVDHNTVLHPNIHGNANRLTNRTGGGLANSGNRFVRDHLTGVEYYIKPWTTGNWNSAIDAGVDVNAELGETGWYSCPIRILTILNEYATASAWTSSPFNAPTSRTIWSSTTNVVTNSAWGMQTSNQVLSIPTKTNTINMIIGIFCRKFF